MGKLLKRITLLLNNTVFSNSCKVVMSRTFIKTMSGPTNAELIRFTQMSTAVPCKFQETGLELTPYRLEAHDTAMYQLRQQLFLNSHTGRSCPS
jgi:hypothetical protein